MAKTKTPSIVSQIVEKLYTEGAMSVSKMCETIKFPYKSVYTKALELKTMGLADKDDNGVWSLKEGVTPRTLETGELEEPGAGAVAEETEELGEEGKPAAAKGAPMARSKGAPLDAKSVFMEQLRAVGVQPKEVIPTIAGVFFSGDIDSLKWLNQVLSRDAASFVAPNQRRLVISFWANTRGLPYVEEEFDFTGTGEAAGRKAGVKEEEKEPKKEKRLDPGIGWKIAKDKDGEWVAEPGGPMSYAEAVEAAKERQVISAYAKGRGEAEPEGEETGEEGAPGRKGGKKTESFVEYMMKKVVDNMFEGKGAQRDGESETVRKLTERIETMEKERQEERFDRIEGMIAEVVSRDPWADYDKIEAMKQRLGIGGSVVTDQSPAVQLIKDTTDKMDKNVNRMVGLIERTILHGETFNPETTRSPKEREKKAGELLGEVESRDRSRGLRKDTFGV